MIRHLPPRESALVRETNPEYVASWTTSETLLADAANSLRNANWQRSGGKGDRPKLHLPPGAEPDTEKVGGESLPPEEFRRRMYGGGDAWAPDDEGGE